MEYLYRCCGSPAALSSPWPDGSFSAKAAIRSWEPPRMGLEDRAARSGLLSTDPAPGPGTIAVVISLGLSRASYTSSTDEIVFVLASLAAAVAIAITIFLCFAYADRVQRLLGPGGTDIALRLVGVYSVLPRYPD